MKDHGRFKSKRTEASLSITSMMDMMTIILVFLLKSFAAEGQILTNADDLILPLSSSKKNPQEISLQLSITQDGILIDNIPIVKVKNIKTDAQGNIMDLMKVLERHYRQEENMVKVGALKQVKGQIIIQVDKNMAFDYLYQVMFTCGTVGYNDIHLAVMNREES